MTDIVERISAAADLSDMVAPDTDIPSVLRDAASEIERLRNEVSDDDGKRELESLTSIIERLPRGTWEVWNSNSCRRITAVVNGRNGVDGGVLRGTVHPRDNWPDLSMSEAQLQALCDLRNTVARLCGVDQ